MLSDLLATKLYRPALPARRVARPQLVRCLNEGLAAGRRLTLVSAPPGFGKTTCVCEWLSEAGLPVAWLSLEPADDDPARFLAYLLAALQTVDGSIGRELAAALQAGRPLPAASLVTGLLNDVLRVEGSFILALDDFHVIRQPAILDAVARLIAGQPANLHLVLVTREDPVLPLARLRANNQLTELRAADLRFSGRESAAFLNDLMDLALSEADIAALAGRTEGWIAGLQLAGLSVRGRPDPSAFIAGLSGSHRHILGYLTEEVLDRQPPALRAFLLQTSILDRLSGDLCAAVAGRQAADCAALLERLTAANLFLVPLDDERTWYRYHHLFGQLLATRLRQEVPAGEIRGLHCRASDWLAQRDLDQEAIRHALAGEDFARAVALVEKVARALIFAGRIGTLRGWLAAFPAAFRAAHPRLEVYGAWIDLLQDQPDLGEEGMQAREQLLQALPPSPENDRLRVELTVILCRLAPMFANTARTVRLAQEALLTVPHDDLVARARLVFALAVAHSLEGDPAAAEPEFRECLRLARAAGDSGLAAEMLGLQALDLYHRGRLSEAARCYEAIVALPGPPEPFYPAGLGYIGLAGIYLERLDLERAEACLSQGMELCARGGLDAVYSGHTAAARLCQARGDVAGALAQIEAVEQAFRRSDDPNLLARRVAIARATGDVASLPRLVEPWLKLLAAAERGERPPASVLEIVRILVARAWLALDEMGPALAALDEARATAEPARRLTPLIQIYLLRGLALGRGPAALAAIARALALAEPEGYALLFLEEGPVLLPLLQAIAADRSTPERLRAYAGRLLAAGAGRAAPLAARPALAHDEAPVEPLTERELEILRLIGAGCTNQEIAGRLVVTLHTVKKHTSNLFGKLGVGSRTQAVARARRLGLLE